MSFLDLARSRYSCRSFSDKAVEQEKLNLVLEAGRIAPTATNAQPVHVYVLRSSESLEKIRAATRMAYNAPVVLMVCFDTSRSYKALAHGDDHDCGFEDASIVTTHMMLAAKDCGLESLWARGFKAEDIKKAMGIPDKMELVCLLDIGYASSENGGPGPRHALRNPLSDFAEEF